MKNPILTALLLIAVFIYPPVALLFIPIALGRIMHYLRLRRMVPRQRRRLPRK